LPKVTLAKYDDMVEYFPPDRANQPFSVGVLPWRSWCRWSVTNAYRAMPQDDGLAMRNRDLARYSPAQPPSRKPPLAVAQSTQPSDLRQHPAI
jgi:hypothetical protein